MRVSTLLVCFVEVQSALVGGGPREVSAIVPIPFHDTMLCMHSGKDASAEKHPEKRMKAAYKAYGQCCAH